MNTIKKPSLLFSIVLSAAIVLQSCAPQVQLGQQGRKLGLQWMAQNPWYSANVNDSDTKEVLRIDQQLYKEGYNPETQAYWDELTRRVRYAMPQHFLSEQQMKAKILEQKSYYCRNKGLQPKTTKYKKCLANAEHLIAKEREEKFKQMEAENAQQQRQAEYRQQQIAIQQQLANQQVRAQQPSCTIIPIDPQYMAGIAGLEQSINPSAKALAASKRAEVAAIEQQNALCSGGTQGYYQQQQLEAQRQALELQKEQLRQQNDLANAIRQNQAIPTPRTTLTRCEANGFGGVECRHY